MAFRLAANECLIGLGGNVGDVRRRMRMALPQIEHAAQGRIVAVSGLYETAPMGGLASPTFGNAALRLKTPLESAVLLDRLLSVEAGLGRIRGVTWGPRTIDLDLLCHGDRVMRNARLVLPHPGCWYRRFVLDPLQEIAGEMAHPRWKMSFDALRHRLLPTPLPVRFIGLDEQFRDDVTGLLRDEFPKVCAEFHVAQGFWKDGLVIIDGGQETAVTAPMIDLRRDDVMRSPGISVLDQLRFALQAATDFPQRRGPLV